MILGRKEKDIYQKTRQKTGSKDSYQNNVKINYLIDIRLYE
jgi:hypothetical protein